MYNADVLYSDERAESSTNMFSFVTRENRDYRKNIVDTSASHTHPDNMNKRYLASAVGLSNTKCR